MKKHTISYLFILLTQFLFAQGDSGSNDFFKSNLKIYVVVAVLTIILACIFVFLFALEKRLSALEKK